MLDVTLDVSKPEVSNSLQRWRAFYVLMTLDLPNTEHLLTSATELITAACGASACVITYHPLDTVTVRWQYGTVINEAGALVSQTEQAFLQGRLTPLWQTLHGVPYVALPLNGTGEYVGAIHVVAPGPEIDPDELRLAATMLNNTLQRQSRSEQVVTAEQECTNPSLPAHDPTHYSSLLNDTERKLTKDERTWLIRREMEVRAQIGRDLHDGPVQQIAVADVAVQYARRVAQHAPERLPKALDDLQAQLKRITRDLRTVLYELRPLGIAEEGLLSVLQQYVERFHDANGIHVHLDAPPHLRRLDPDHEAAIFNIVREAVNNARKHAAARDIWIKLHEDAQALYVEVRDNGRGFDLQAVESGYIQRGSYGLLNMRERALLIGGNCAISSEPGQGTSIEIRVPFN